MVDRRCRESKGKAKIEGYMSVSDEEAHHRVSNYGGPALRKFVILICATILTISQ